jgi:hypothetical protein
VITLWHNVAVLKIPCDTGRLFDGDELYQLTLEMVVELVGDTYEQERSRS